MRDRSQKCLDRLPGQRAAAEVGDRARDHHGKTRVGGEKFRDRKECGLGVQRVKNGFDKQDVHAAGNEVLHLFEISGDDLFKRDIAFSRIVHIAGNRERAVERSDGTGHKDMPVGAGVRRLACQLRRRTVQLGNKLLEAVVRLGNDRSAEGVCLNDIRARSDVFGMDLADHVRAREHEQIIISLQVLPFPIRKLLAAIVRLLQLVSLHHRPHRPVKDENAFGQ